MWAAVVVAAAKADMVDALEAAAAELRAALPAAPAAASSAEVAWCKIQTPSRRQMLRRTRKGRRRHDSICGTCSSLGVPHRRSEEYDSRRRCTHRVSSKYLVPSEEGTVMAAMPGEAASEVLAEAHATHNHRNLSQGHSRARFHIRHHHQTRHRHKIHRWYMFLLRMY